MNVTTYQNTGPQTGLARPGDIYLKKGESPILLVHDYHAGFYRFVSLENGQLQAPGGIGKGILTEMEAALHRAGHQRLAPGDSVTIKA